MYKQGVNVSFEDTKNYKRIPVFTNAVGKQNHNCRAADISGPTTKDAPILDRLVGGENRHDWISQNKNVIYTWKKINTKIKLIQWSDNH